MRSSGGLARSRRFEEFDRGGLGVERCPVLRGNDRDLVGLDVDIEIGVDRRQLECGAMRFEDLGDPVDVEGDFDTSRRILHDLHDRSAADLIRGHREDNVSFLVVQQDRAGDHTAERGHGVVDVRSSELRNGVGEGKFGHLAFRHRQDRIDEGDGRRPVDALANPGVLEVDLVADNGN